MVAVVLCSWRVNQFREDEGHELIKCHQSSWPRYGETDWLPFVRSVLGAQY